MVEVGAVVMGDGVVEVGTVETEPLLVSVLVSGCLAGRWLRLPTIQHPITQHPATATPLLQSPHHLVLVRSISAILPICSHVPGSMATSGPVNDLNQHPSKKRVGVSAPP